MPRETQNKLNDENIERTQWLNLNQNKLYSESEKGSCFLVRNVCISKVFPFKSFSVKDYLSVIFTI